MKDFELELKSKRRFAIRIRVVFAVVFVYAVADAFILGFAYVNTNAFANTFANTFVNAYVYEVSLAIMFLLESDRVLDFMLGMSDVIKNHKTKESKIDTPLRYKLLKLTEFCFSVKTQKEVFQPIMSDWDEEIFEALKKDKDAKLFMINVRYIYAFIVAMWQKSPIGDLIEFVKKIAK